MTTVYRDLNIPQCARATNYVDMQIQRIWYMPQLIEYLEKRGAYNKMRIEWRALEDHLEFITLRQCVNTRRENDKQHSAERCV